ncbi:uncharacterized protein CMU_037690 [Cryptosporidium muris RN66]|uniref:rRNA-processing protein EFG1 n=1 Tax=Cryptosporidium muris (strain RN66) TaxID=441375 RepID=B6A913_CRYMR|nr:uncharacterized protein CMU_037690 [Cryptosporidium muris RN66]EEA04704.1 hypothetical protein, conserved [Cryptosporidium muris RN66]|eukprot:XP_002139053.1 hypothetical protein [Cryptosporidium muris RN66]
MIEQKNIGFNQDGSNTNSQNKSSKKRYRDLKRLLSRENLQIPQEARESLQLEFKKLEDIMARGGKSNHEKKIARYLEYRRNRDKKMRFTELVKVKRQLNRIQHKLADLIGNNNFSTDSQELDKLKSEMIKYSKLQDYIRLYNYSKQKWYIPLFPSTQLDDNITQKRDYLIEEIQKIKKELRIRKMKPYTKYGHKEKDIFLIFDEGKNIEDSKLAESEIMNKDESSVNYKGNKINYIIKDSNVQVNKLQKKVNKRLDKVDKKKTFRDENPKPMKMNKNEGKQNTHIVFEDSD